MSVYTTWCNISRLAQALLLTKSWPFVIGSSVWRQSGWCNTTVIFQSTCQAVFQNAQWTFRHKEWVEKTVQLYGKNLNFHRCSPPSNLPSGSLESLGVICENRCVMLVVEEEYVRAGYHHLNLNWSFLDASLALLRQPALSFLRTEWKLLVPRQALCPNVVYFLSCSAGCAVPHRD